jgi:hypothetical protein
MPSVMPPLWSLSGLAYFASISEAPGHPSANRRHRHNPFASLRADEHAHVGKGGEPLTKRHQQAAAAEDGARPVSMREIAAARLRARLSHNAS